MSLPAGGGFNIGSIAGNASFSAGGDIVAGDKITRTTTSTVLVESGFRQESDKQEFLQQIEELRTALRGMQARIQTAPDVSDDDKDEIAGAVLQQLGALKETKEEAAGVAVDREPPAETRERIERSLQDTCTVLDRVKDVCDRTVGIAETVGPYVVRALPLLLSARHLFGLP